MAKRKVKKAGDKCRHCNTPTISKIPKIKELKKGQTYFFKRYLVCPNCNTMYMLESEKVYVNA